MPLDNDLAERVWVPPHAIYECCYEIKPDKSYELQRRNQRQAAAGPYGGAGDPGPATAPVQPARAGRQVPRSAEGSTLRGR
jgi:hypothetical protein